MTMIMTITLTLTNIMTMIRSWTWPRPKRLLRIVFGTFYKASIQHLILLKVHIDIFEKFYIFIFLTKKNYDLGLKLLCLHIRALEESRPEIFRFKFYILQIFFLCFSDIVLLLGGCISQQKCRPEKRMIACYSAFLLPSQLHTFPCWVNRWVTATLEFWHKEWL